MTSDYSVNNSSNFNIYFDYYLGNNAILNNNTIIPKEKRNIYNRNIKYYNKFSMKQEN